jgi:hypothetical protein
MTHPPRLTMPSTGGLTNRNFRYLGGGTSLDLHKRMAKYRVAVAKEVPLLPLKHPKGSAL